jgi:hypothetical protein
MTLWTLFLISYWLLEMANRVEALTEKALK